MAVCPTAPACAGSAVSTVRRSVFRPKRNTSPPIASGAGWKPIDNWSFYVAFCFFRLTAILQGVYKRALDGNASNPTRAKEMATAVPLLAQAALQEIDA